MGALIFLMLFGFIVLGPFGGIAGGLIGLGLLLGRK